jgi:Uma2 family endonuclease
MTPHVKHRLFNVDDYYRMADAGILDEDSNVELIEGAVLLKHEEDGRPAGCRRLFNVDEYYRMAEFGIVREDERLELLEGEIIEMPPIGSHHSGAVNRLTALLTGRIGSQAIVSVQNPLRLSDVSSPQPDCALLQPRPDFYTGSHPVPEDVLLLIEVADRSLDTDQQVKLPLYARASIPEVWIVALNDDAIEVYRGPGEAGTSRSLH